MPSASPGEFEEFLAAEEPHSQDTIPQCMGLRFAPRLGSRIIHGGKWEMGNEEMKPQP